MVRSYNTPESTPADRTLIHEEETHVVETPAGAHGSRLSWSAVTAGSLLSIGLLVLAAQLGYATGIPAFSGGLYGTGAALYSILFSALAFFAGGCLVTYLTPRSDLRSGLVHGVMAWVLAVPLIFILFSLVAGLGRGLIGADVTHMTVAPMVNQPTRELDTGAAWGTFLSLLVGLLAAGFGGKVGTGRYNLSSYLPRLNVNRKA